MSGQALTQQITVLRDEHEPESVEVIAASIIAIAEAFERIERGPLTQRAIVLLLRDITGMSLGEITKVLDAVPKLRQFVKKKART
jgi:hypothetical protein